MREAAFQYFRARSRWSAWETAFWLAWLALFFVPGANLALFANYLAASFPAAIGRGGTLITDALERAGLEPLLARPHTG